MVELLSGMDFHNFNLDCKPKEWFKRGKKETVGEWLTRVSYHPKRDFLQDLRFREKNEYWLKDSARISLYVLSFLRKNNLSKEKMEEDLNMEIDLSNSYDYRLSEMCKIKNYMKDVNRSKL